MCIAEILVGKDNAPHLFTMVWTTVADVNPTVIPFSQ